MPDYDYSELLERLKRFYRSSRNLPPDMVDVGEGLPPVAIPESSAIFEPDPPITGDPEFVRFATKLLDTSRGAKMRTSRINTGPTAGSIWEGVEEEDNPEVYPKGLGGVYSLSPYGDQSIGIPHGKGNPIVNKWALGHEVAHSAGYGDAPEGKEKQTAYEASNIFADWYNKRRNPETRAMPEMYGGPGVIMTVTEEKVETPKKKKKIK